MIDQDYRRGERQSEGAGQPAGRAWTDLSDVPTDFQLAALAVLRQQFGPKFAQIPPGAVDQLVSQLWTSPALQSTWSDYANPPDGMANPPTLANVRQLINYELADPGRSDNPDIVQTFVGLKDQLGVPLTGAEKSFDRAASSPIPYPWDPQFNVVSGNDYGDTGMTGASAGYGDTHLGVDYGTPEGTPIASPFAGTVEVQTGVADYGNLVLVHLDNGYTMAFGHVGSASVANGMRVNPGDIIALSGANVGDSEGAVTLVEWRDPQGNLLNPHDVLDPIFKGATFASLDMQGAVGQGVTAADAALARYGIYDKTMETVYGPLRSLWQKYFGREPTTAQLASMVAHGKDPSQAEDYIRSLPLGRIAGITVGQYYDRRSLADKISQAIYGHPSNDSIVTDLYNKGAESQSDVQAYYDAMQFTPGQHVDAATYNTVYQANLPHAMGLYNDYPHPDAIKQQIAAAGGAPVDAGQAAAAAQALPVAGQEHPA